MDPPCGCGYEKSPGSAELTDQTVRQHLHSEELVQDFRPGAIPVRFGGLCLVGTHGTVGTPKASPPPT